MMKSDFKDLQLCARRASLDFDYVQCFLGNTTEKVKVWEQKVKVFLDEPFSITHVEVDYDIVFEVNSS